MGCAVNKKSIIVLCATSALISACSQPPAPIALKGSQFYGRDGMAAVQQPDYVPPSASVSAPIHSMEVADLTPPSSAVSTVDLPATLPAPNTSFAAPQPAPEPLAPLESFAAAPIAPQITTPAPQLGELSTRASNFIWPVEGPIVSRFGPKKNGLVNDGINIAAREGEPIWSAAKGEVVYAGNELKGYGNMMIIRHSNGWMSAYAHTSDMLVKKGALVNQGDLIGYVGKTGAVTTAQLHFGIRDGKTPIDPETLLPRRVASAQ